MASQDVSARGLGGQPSTRMAKKHEQYDFRPKTKGPLSVAETWLYQYLSNGPLPEDEIKDAAKNAGIDPRVLGRALSNLAEVSEPETEEGTRTWALQANAEEPEPRAEIIVEGAEVPVDHTQTHEDQFALTSEERRMYGIRANEQHCWIQDPDYWSQRVPGDPTRTHLRTPGARVVIHKGDYVRNGPDLILATVPMEHVERNKAEHREQVKELEEDLKGRLRSDSFTLKANVDDDRVRAQAEFNTEANHQMGLTGPMSPSSGLSYDEYLKYRGISPEAERREAVEHALGRFYSNDLTDAQVKQAYEAGVLPREMAEQVQAAGGGQPRGSSGKFISIPQNVRPRNLQSR